MTFNERVEKAKDVIVDKMPEFVFATHPDKPNYRSNTRSRVLHIKNDDKTTLCKMLITETPFSISLGYGFKPDPDEYDQCQNCVNLFRRSHENKAKAG